MKIFLFFFFFTKNIYVFQCARVSHLQLWVKVIPLSQQPLLLNSYLLQVTRQRLLLFTQQIHLLRFNCLDLNTPRRYKWFLCLLCSALLFNELHVTITRCKCKSNMQGRKERKTVDFRKWKRLNKCVTTWERSNKIDVSGRTKILGEKNMLKLMMCSLLGVLLHVFWFWKYPSIYRIFSKVGVILY